MLGVEIKFPGLSEGIIGIEALLGNPEGMFKTDKNSNERKQRRYIELSIHKAMNILHKRKKTTTKTTRKTTTTRTNKRKTNILEQNYLQNLPCYLFEIFTFFP